MAKVMSPMAFQSYLILRLFISIIAIKIITSSLHLQHGSSLKFLHGFYISLLILRLKAMCGDDLFVVVMALILHFLVCIHAVYKVKVMCVVAVMKKIS